MIQTQYVQIHMSVPILNMKRNIHISSAILTKKKNTPKSNKDYSKYEKPKLQLPAYKRLETIMSRVQRRLWGELTEMFRYDLAKRIFDCDLNDGTRSN